MRLLLELWDKDVGEKEKNVRKKKTRTAARAVILSKGKVALLHVSRHHYYKLPGGGVDEGETIEEGLRREVLEEVGATIAITGDVGKTIEHRSHEQLVQTSHCYLARAVKIGKSKLELGEIADGFRLVWVPMDTAFMLLKTSRPDTYDGKFIVKRDLCLLREAKR